MKKAYVKPVMESEAFVANEYVAACKQVECSYHGSFIYHDEPTPENDDDGFWYYEGFSIGGIENIGASWYYTGDKLGNFNMIEPNGHRVTVKDIATTDHPNASA